MAKVEGIDDTVLLVDIDAKTARERSMYELFIGRYETGLSKIKAGIEGKGTKKRDKVNARLWRLDAKFPGVRKNYDIVFTYNENDVVTSMIWSKNDEVDEITRRMHGKYLLQTSLDEKEEENIWEFYNVIRTVEETFKTLKSALGITALPVCSIKSVWLREQPPEKDPPLKSGG